MNHTPQIKKAIQFAAKKHDGYFRAETEKLPYITHLFSVALLVAEDGADDDVVSAALLHDTIEDTGTTREEIAAAFNERVATLVSAVSESKDLPWRARKELYLSDLEKVSEDALHYAVLTIHPDRVDYEECTPECAVVSGAASPETKKAKAPSASSSVPAPAPAPQA